MLLKPLAMSIAVWTVMLMPSASASHILESFTILTQDVKVRQLTESSIQFTADTHAYVVKLVPNEEGKVVFSLSGIGYATTARCNNLKFGVSITGYHQDEIVYPTFSRDDINREITIDRNKLVFERIYGTLPVWFNTQVDSILLKFSNSYALNVDQYLAIQDLRIVSSLDVRANPNVIPCKDDRIMIAIDGSSSIDKHERGIIADQLLDFVRKSEVTKDSIALCLLEFGSDIVSIVESENKRTLIDALQKYKRDRNDRSKFTSWTNWSVVFDEAVKREPEVFIFITDGWSNWNEQRPSSFSAQYESLIMKSNMLKGNGTRLLFVTSDMDIQHNTQEILSSFLNSDMTRVVNLGALNTDIDLNQVDLVSMNNFTSMPEVNFASLITCQDESQEQIKTVSAATQVPDPFGERW